AVAQGGKRAPGQLEGELGGERCDGLRAGGEETAGLETEASGQSGPGAVDPGRAVVGQEAGGAGEPAGAVQTPHHSVFEPIEERRAVPGPGRRSSRPLLTLTAPTAGEPTGEQVVRHGRPSPPGRGLKSCPVNTRRTSAQEDRAGRIDDAVRIGRCPGGGCGEDCSPGWWQLPAAAQVR